MKASTYASLFCATLILAGCGQSEEKVPVGSKDNFDKSIKVLNDNYKRQNDADKKLDEELEKSKNASPKPIK